VRRGVLLPEVCLGLDDPGDHRVASATIDDQRAADEISGHLNGRSREPVTLDAAY
jgi:hypothetical protein